MTQTVAEDPATGTMTDRQANHSRRWWILAVLGIAQLMVILDNTIVNIALPTAQHALAFSNADRQWVVTGYSLAFGSLLLLGGRIGDIIGRKRALMIGLIGFAAASALGGASTGFPMLVAARSIQGAFGALLAPSVLALLATTFTDPAERDKAFAIYGGIAGAGGAIGLLLGGVLTSYASWRWTLFVNLGFAAVAAVGALLWLRNDKAADRDPLDIPGVALVTAGLFSIVYGLSHAETTSWHNPFTIAFLVVGVLLLGGVRLHRDPRPLSRCCPPGWCGTAPGAARWSPCSSPASGSSASSCSSRTTCRGPWVSVRCGRASPSCPWWSRWPSPPRSPTGCSCPGSVRRSSFPSVWPVTQWRCSCCTGSGCTAPTSATSCRIWCCSGWASGSAWRRRSAPAPSASGPTTPASDRRPSTRPSRSVVRSARRCSTRWRPERPRAYLVGKVPSPETLRSAALHSYTTAFLWSSAFFVAGAVLAGLIFEKGNLGQLAGAGTDRRRAGPCRRLSPIRPVPTAPAGGIMRCESSSSERPTMRHRTTDGRDRTRPAGRSIPARQPGR